MPFRSIIAEPHELAKLSAAFDAAWIGINDTAPIALADQTAAREKLGRILIRLWREGEEHLAARGAELFPFPATPKSSEPRD
ncbi:hypothetical protein OIU35_30310 [Boseaceae bacterium BT-24-1]|nr:hypothetical protein [Boseaceae bacterium BT-24-1]